MSTDNPGGTAVVRRPGLAAHMKEGWNYYNEMGKRDSENLLGVSMVDTIDSIQRPPKWIERKDRTVLGYPVLPDDRDSNYWENKYARELAIGEMRFEKKKENFMLEQHDVIGTYRTVMRYFGLMKPEATPDELTEEAEKKFEDRVKEAQEEERKKKLDWNAFVAALESDKPLLAVARDYRNVYDCYGLDECLDASASMLWLSFRVGAFIGLCQGGFRAVKVMHVDTSFLKASGIGVMTFANVSMLAGVGKWAGNLTMACAMFLIGDRAVRQAKRLTMPEGAEPQRTPVNYAVGLGMSFGVAGILPWWVLNDAAMGARLAVSSSVVGGALGYVMGLGIQRLIALNLARLDYSPPQFRAYQALMKREKAYVESESARLKRARRTMVDQGLATNM
jgi:hypothetical protein